MRILAAVLASIGCLLSFLGEWMGSTCFWAVCSGLLCVSHLQDRKEDE